MPIVLLFGVLGFGLWAYAKGGVGGLLKVHGLKDVLPENQGGKFRRDFDDVYLRASNKTGVPFALLKAHAIRESSQKASATLDESAGRADRRGWRSRGLMQILWAPPPDKLAERFSKYGFPSSKIGDGSLLFDPDVNVEIAARLIKDNLDAAKGNLRDAINMYNTGVKESVRVAPHNYVNDVERYYKDIIGE